MIVWPGRLQGEGLAYTTRPVDALSAAARKTKAVFSPCPSGSDGPVCVCKVGATGSTSGRSPSPLSFLWLAPPERSIGRLRRRTVENHRVAWIVCIERPRSCGRKFANRPEYDHVTPVGTARNVNGNPPLRRGRRFSERETARKNTTTEESTIHSDTALRYLLSLCCLRACFSLRCHVPTGPPTIRDAFQRAQSANDMLVDSVHSVGCGGVYISSAKHSAIVHGRQLHRLIVV